ncbi:MAG: biotin--[acetyl-CoA-carboxylase] ligase [Verrucomicrobiota bacterium]
MHSKILEKLKQQTPEFLSGEELCRQLGITRSAVWKHIGNLRKSGYQIESVTNRGYKLNKIPNAPLPAEITPLLHTSSIGRTIHYLDQTASTNKTARQHAENGATHGTVIVTDHQTQGRGRLQRNWYSPAGANLYLSIILRPPLPPMSAPSFSLLTGLAVRRACCGFAADQQIAIKWPNDIFINGKKTAGILADISAEQDCINHLIIGIGVNVNLESQNLPPALQETATSLKIETGRSINRPALAAAILDRLEELYDPWLKQGLTPFLDELHHSSLLLNREVSVSNPRSTIRGKVTGITPNGELSLQTETGAIQTIAAGDASIVNNGTVKL